MGLFSKKKENRKPVVYLATPGKSCLDCKHCDTTKANEYGQVYCRWDDCYYFAETGRDCDHFDKSF